MPEETTLRTISVLVDNEAGVLSEISRLFSRKGYNIESLSVGCTTDSKISRFTIEVLADDRQIDLLCNQLRKLIPVHSVKLLDPAQSLRRELVLIKVRTENSEICNRVMQIANIFRASVLDVSPTTVTISMISKENKTEAILGLLKEFGVMELARTGVVALERGEQTIYDHTKERGEFDYGKSA